MDILKILESVKAGEMEIEEAKSLIDSPIDYAVIDYDRQKRTGAPEIIYGAGKDANQIGGIIDNMLSRGQANIMATRISFAKYRKLKDRFPQFEYDAVAKTLICQQVPVETNKGKIAVVCAGTSDLPVAREAAVTAKFLGNDVVEIADVGVAGLHRLLNRLEDLKTASVIVVIAGMEGALASVVSGLVEAPVVAVPTSVGYGANFQGLSALLSMLNSCASGVSVVNIDNGFGAGYMAHSINCLGGKK